MTAVTFSPDNSRVLSVARDGVAYLWQTTTGTKLSSLTDNSYPGFDDATWKPDGSAFTTAAYYEIVPGAGTGSVARFKTWDVTSGGLQLTIEGSYEAIIDWGPDGVRSAGGELKDSGIGAIKTWDAATGTEGVSFSGISGRIADIVWSPDGRFLAAGNQWGDVSVWEVATSKEIVLKGLDTYDSVHNLAWSPDGTRLAATLDSSKVKVWTLISPSEPFTIYSDVNRFIYGLSWSPDGTQLAASGDGQSVQIWNAITGQELVSLIGHIGSVTTLDWSSDGQFLVSGSRGAEVILWSLFFK